MAERVPFLLRLDPAVMAALKRWAADDMRSLNSQIEFLLRRSLAAERRLPERPPTEGREEAERDSPG